MVDSFLQSYSNAMDDAYQIGWQEQVKEEYAELSEWGVEVRTPFDSFTINVWTAMHTIWRNKLPRDITATHYLKWVFEQKKIDWEVDPMEMMFDCFDKKAFEKSYFQGEVQHAIEEQQQKYDDERIGDTLQFEDEIQQIEKMGITLGKWTTNNVTPDKKFKFNITDVDMDKRMFHVRLWDMDRKRSITGYMTPDGIKKLATVPTLFDAEEMLNESLSDDNLMLPDKMRVAIIEEAMEAKSHRIILENIYMRPDATRNRGGISYNEVWTNADITALRSQPGFAKLPLQEAFSKFIDERFKRCIKMLSYEVVDYQFTPHINEDVDYDWVMHVSIRKC
jgi:hypothetical protein